MNDALERLKNKPRKKVPPRDSVLQSQISSTNIDSSISPDSPISKSQESSVSKNQSNPNSQTNNQIDSPNSLGVQASTSLDTSISKSQESSVSESQSNPNSQTDNQIDSSNSLDVQTSTSLDTSISKSQKLNKSKKNKAKESQSLSEFKNKQTTLRLESDLLKRLTQVCQDNSFSRDVFIETLFNYYEQNPKIWKKIIAQAQEKADIRTQMANKRRAKTMMEKFYE